MVKKLLKTVMRSRKGLEFSEMVWFLIAIAVLLLLLGLVWLTGQKQNAILAWFQGRWL